MIVDMEVVTEGDENSVGCQSEKCHRICSWSLLWWGWVVMIVDMKAVTVGDENAASCQSELKRARQ